DPRLHLVRVALRVDAETARGEEDALAGGVPGESSHELLDRGPAHGVVARVALGLDVDAGEAQGVLIDDPVDPTVPRELRAGGGALGAAVPHRHEQIEDGLLKELRILRL